MSSEIHEIVFKTNTAEIEKAVQAEKRLTSQEQASAKISVQLAKDTSSQISATQKIRADDNRVTNRLIEQDNKASIQRDLLVFKTGLKERQASIRSTQAEMKAAALQLNQAGKLEAAGIGSNVLLGSPEAFKMQLNYELSQIKLAQKEAQLQSKSPLPSGTGLTGGLMGKSVILGSPTAMAQQIQYTQGLSKESERLGQVLNHVGKTEFATFNNNLKKSHFSLMDLKRDIVEFTVIGIASEKIFEFGKDALMTAAKIQDMSKYINASKEDLLEFKVAAGNTITDEELLPMIKYAESLNKTTAETKLAIEQARISARFNGDLAGSFNAIVKGEDGYMKSISTLKLSKTQYTELLKEEVKNMGGLTEAQQEANDEGTLTIKNLSAQQQQTARTIAFNKLFEKSFGDVSSSTRTATEDAKFLGAAWDTVKEGIGAGLLATLTASTQGLVKGGDAAKNDAKALETLKDAFLDIGYVISGGPLKDLEQMFVGMDQSIQSALGNLISFDLTLLGIGNDVNRVLGKAIPIITGNQISETAVNGFLAKEDLNNFGATHTGTNQKNKSGTGKTSREKEVDVVGDLIRAIQNEITYDELTHTLTNDILNTDIDRLKVQLAITDDIEKKIALLNEINTLTEKISKQEHEAGIFNTSAFLKSPTDAHDFTGSATSLVTKPWMSGKAHDANGDPGKKLLSDAGRFASDMENIESTFGVGMDTVVGRTITGFSQVVSMINSIINGGSSAIGFFGSLLGLIVPGGGAIAAAAHAASGMSHGMSRPAWHDYQPTRAGMAPVHVQVVTKKLTLGQPAQYEIYVNGKIYHDKVRGE